MGVPGALLPLTARTDPVYQISVSVSECASRT